MAAGTIIGLSIALGTLMVTLWLGRARLRHERSLADLGDARAILAEGAAELNRCQDALDQLMGKFGQAVFAGSELPDDAPSILADARRHLVACEVVYAGVRVRFPENAALAIAFEEAYEKAREVIYICEWAKYFKEKPGLRKDEDFADMHDAHLQFHELREEYLRAAQEAVGSALGR